MNVQPHPSRPAVNPSVCVAGVLALLAVTTACGRQSTTAPSAPAAKSPPQVTVQRVARKPIQSVMELTGEVVSTMTATLASTIDGPIRFCPWREGDSVSAGQKLIEIDRPVLRDDLRVAESSVAVAAAKLADMRQGSRPEEIAKARESVRHAEESAAFAQTDLNRIADLAKSGALPGEAAEKARVTLVAEQARLSTARRQAEMVEAGPTTTALAVQEASLGEAQARAELARSRLAESVLRAPFAGIITKVHARPGDTALSKVPLLEISSLEPPVVRFAVPEAHVAALRQGMPMEIRLDALPGQVFAGQVNRVYPELDRRMRTRTAEARPVGDVKLLPGMFARVRLVMASATSALVVPTQAVLATPTGERFVFVLEQERAVRRVVRLGIDAGEKVEVLEGLAEGDAVMVGGHKKLKDGMPVRVAVPEKKAGQTP